MRRASLKPTQEVDAQLAAASAEVANQQRRHSTLGLPISIAPASPKSVLKKDEDAETAGVAMMSSSSSTSSSYGGSSRSRNVMIALALIGCVLWAGMRQSQFGMNNHEQSFNDAEESPRSLEEEGCEAFTLAHSFCIQHPDCAWFENSCVKKEAARVLQKTTSFPTTRRPTTARPTTARPTTARPTTARPTTARPTTSRPTTSSPTTSTPTTLEPTTSEPTTLEPTTSEPTTLEPTTSEPTTLEPTTSEPTTLAPSNSPSVPRTPENSFTLDVMFNQPAQVDANGDIMYQADGVTPVAFGPPHSEYVRLMTEVKRRLEELISGDIPATYTYLAGTSCYSKPFTKFSSNIIVDDVLVFVNVDYTYGGIAGAGPCKATAKAPLYNPVGMITVSQNFLNDLIKNPSQFELYVNVMLHECMHILGFGTDWIKKKVVHPLVKNPLTNQIEPTNYNGTKGAELWRQLASEQDVTKLPEVEQNFGAGTAYVHFDECIFDNELMTGVLSDNSRLSLLTCGALQDLGYQIDFSKCESYEIPPFIGCDADGWRNGRRLDVEAENVVEVHNDILGPPEIVEADSP